MPPDRRDPTKKSQDETTLDNFLDFVFGPKLDPDREKIPLWATSRAAPGFPMLEEAWKRKALRAPERFACFFGCSSLTLAEDGHIYSQQRYYAGLYVVVLDDVGTGPGSKITPFQVPPGLRARVSYRVATSPDNEQWGFVLAEPIRDLEHAKAFQKLIIQKSGADQGGCSPTKLVRLPFGVNLKAKYQIDGGPLFRCHLLEMLGHLWTPPEMLAAVDAGTTWAQLQAGTTVSRRAGATAYRAKPAYQASFDGVVDPILDWLESEGKILNDYGGHWLDIACPWAAGHTTGQDSARYSPLGRGERPTERGFKCFHDSCTDNRTPDFLAYVMKSGGPRASRHLGIEPFLARWVLDTEANAFIDMKSPTFRRYPQLGIKSRLSMDIWVPKTAAGAASDEMQAVNAYTLFMKDPARLNFAGRQRVVGGARILPGDEGGDSFLNTWRLPEWGDGPFDLEIVQPFLNFVRYLWPYDDDAEWMLDHLAAKAHDPLYRGAGVITSTPIEGTGRGTFGTILGRMWGAHNFASATLPEMITGASSSDNNSWITADWIMLSEAKDTEMSARTESRAYESIKRFVETGPSLIRVKEKWEVARDVLCYGSVLVCTNHPGVIPLDRGSTRFRRMRNTMEPLETDGFIEFYKWIENSGFEPHLWRWLRARDLSHKDLYARQAPISGEDEVVMALADRRGIDAAVSLSLLFAEECNGGLVYVSEFVKILGGLADELEMPTHGWEKILYRILVNKTEEMWTTQKTRWRVRPDGKAGKSLQPRATTDPRGRSAIVLLQDGGKPEVVRFDSLGVELLAFCRKWIEAGE